MRAAGVVDADVAMDGDAAGVHRRLVPPSLRGSVEGQRQVHLVTGRPYVVGLDLSLTATGVAYEAGEQTIRSRERGPARLDDIAGTVVAVCQSLEAHRDAPVLVVIEDYAFSRGDAHAHELGELGGVVRVELWRADFEYVVVGPTTLKRYATGRGKADKGAVLAEAIRRLHYMGSSHNEADALWLRAAALDHYGHPLTPMPQSHRDALAKVAWPVLTERVP